MTPLSQVAKHLDGVSFGEMMRFFRERSSLSARVLSLRAGVSPSYVSKIERGDFYPALDRFARLVDHMKVRDDELVFLVRVLSESE